MARPITAIQLKQQSIEEQQAEQLASLQAQIAEQQQALEKLVEITAGLNDAGVLDAVKAAVQAKDELAGIAVAQISREPMLNLVKHVMNGAELIGSIDAEKSAKLIDSVQAGFQEAELADGNGKTIGLFDLIRLLNDPDVNRAVKFGVHFLKGMGKGLDQE